MDKSKGQYQTVAFQTKSKAYNDVAKRFAAHLELHSAAPQSLPCEIHDASVDCEAPLPGKYPAQAATTPS